jgi:hypothetical protein
MGLLDFFKRKGKHNKSSKPTKSSDISISYSDKFLRIWAVDFFGPYTKSPGGKYIVGWQDADYERGSRGGYRESGFGRVILVSGNKILFQVDMARPCEAVVSEKGIVAIHDIGFGEKPRGTFYILDQDGKKLVEYHINASFPDCGISSQSELAWISTGNHQILIFSVSPPEFLFEIEDIDLPDSVSVQGAEILVTFRGISRRYDRSGRLLNPDEIEITELKWLLQTGDSYRLERKAVELLKNGDSEPLPPEAIKTIQSLLEKAIYREPEAWNKAKLHRKLGELTESQGDQVEALKQYTLAIEYDPKVGCKRALARLEKALKQ